MHAFELHPSDFLVQKCNVLASHIQHQILPLASPSQGQHHSLLIAHPAKIHLINLNLKRNLNKQHAQTSRPAKANVYIEEVFNPGDHYIRYIHESS